MNREIELFDPETGEILTGLPHPIHHDLHGGPVFVPEDTAEIVNKLLAGLLRTGLVKGHFVVKHQVDKPDYGFLEIFHAKAPSFSPKRREAATGTLAPAAPEAQRVTAQKRRTPTPFEIWTRGLNRLSGAPKART